VNLGVDRTNVNVSAYDSVNDNNANAALYPQMALDWIVTMVG